MHKFISIDRVFSRLSKSITDAYSEDDIIEWIGEALEFMETQRAFEESVAFIEVIKHECDIPNGTQSIIQIGRNRMWTGPNTNTVNCITPTVLQAECVAQKVVGDCNNCFSIMDDAVWIDCHGQPIVDYDLAYYRPYFDLQMEYYGWSNCSYYRQNFTPVVLKTQSFFNSVVCTDPTCPTDFTGTAYPNTGYNANINNNGYNGACSKDEYSIINRSRLRFSFECGQVAIAFNKQVTDTATGYPMIPDSISHITAATAYISLRVAERDFDSNRQGSDSRLKYWADQWNWYCGQAVNNDKMLVGVDEHENFRRQRQYMLPRDNYYNFFGKMNEPEDRVWNGRNMRGNNKLIL